MRLKLFKKYFFITVSIVAASLLALMMILSVVLNKHMSDSAYDSLGKCCEQISYSFENFSFEEDRDKFLNIALPLAKVSGSDIFITDSDGAVMICACDEWRQNEKCMHSSYVVPKNIFAQIDEAKYQISTLDMYKYPQYVSVMPLTDEEKHFVFAVSAISESRTLLSRVSKLFYLWAIIPLVFMVVAIYIMTYRLTKPLKSMSEAAKAMSKGDFSKRVPVTSDDEIGELAASFNMMTNSLSRLESMRRSFVGNVSHELRTPMTTIAGFIDGILDGTIKKEDSEYYLNIVSQEVKRLSRLVNGMLSVARLESGESVLKISEFDFYELLCTIMVSQEQRIEEKKLDIVGLDLMQETKLKADKDLLYQVVYNLIDNAIKFTDDAGKISFALADDGINITFTITNTGKGIAKDELPFVFERFYKGDKARSDVKNSTGLGLYIVKTIVSAHKGKISVMSKEDDFTSFKVILPKEI